MAAFLPEALGTGTEWMNGYRQAQREDKAELDRLRAENERIVQEWKDSNAVKNMEIHRLRAENVELRMGDKHPGPHTAEEWCVICDSYADENQRLSDEIDRLRAENSVLEDRCALHREVSRTNHEEIDRLRAEKAEANNQWRLDYNACAAERDRLRAEVKRLEAVQSSCHRDIIRLSDENAELKSGNTRNVSPLDDQSR